MNPRKTISMLSAALVLTIGVVVRTSTAPLAIPNPVLVPSGQAPFTANGKQLMRYNYFVENSSSFPNALSQRRRASRHVGPTPGPLAPG
jgi:hypothetical protein